MIAGTGIWAATVPWIDRVLVGHEIDVPVTTEIVDHVLPGLALLAIAALLRASHRFPLRATLWWSAAASAATAFWIGATHASLIAHGLSGAQPLGAGLLHAHPTILIAALTVAIIRVRRNIEAAPARPQTDR